MLGKKKKTTFNIQMINQIATDRDSETQWREDQFSVPMKSLSENITP